MKNDKYFEDYIIYQNKRIAKFKQALNAISPSDIDKRQTCLGILAGFQRDLINAKYSIGALKPEMKKVVCEYINIIKEIGVNNYEEYINVISLAILFDLMDEVAEISTKEPLNDRLTDILMGKPNVEKELRFKEYYGQFCNYLEGFIGLIEFEKYMNEEWYKSSEGMYWYDSHKSTEDVYTGYWSWLAAACLKVKKEGEHGTVQFIPYDVI